MTYSLLQSEHVVENNEKYLTHHNEPRFKFYENYHILKSMAENNTDRLLLLLKLQNNQQQLIFF